MGRIFHRKQNSFDERQLWIRGSIFQGAVVLYAVELLLNAFLVESGIAWAPPFNTNLIMAILPITVASVMLIARDAYVPNQTSQLLLGGAMGVFSLLGVGHGVAHWARGDHFFEAGGLNEQGAFCVVIALLACIAAALIFQALRSRRQNKIQKSEKEDAL
jgi:phosphate/sulfate permease